MSLACRSARPPPNREARVGHEVDTETPGETLQTVDFTGLPEGTRTPTHCLEGSCSIQLSYGQPGADDTVLETLPALRRHKACGDLAR